MVARSPRLVLTCGVAGSGKSTYARRLESQGWARFSIDREAFALGHIDASAVPPEVAAGIRARQRVAIAQALDGGRDVVADYSFWSRAQRDDYRRLGRAHGATVEVVWFDTPVAVLRERLAARRGEHADDFLVGEALLADYLAGFEAPGPDETDVTTMRPAGP